jgi:HlyD family secretion protein
MDTSHHTYDEAGFSGPTRTRRGSGPTGPCALVLLLGIALAGCGETPPANVLRASGHVEATDVQVAPEVGGRLLELRVNEGDRVNVGDLIARIDTRDTELQIQRLRAERAGADAQLRLLQAGSRAEDVRQAQAQVDAAAADVTAIEAELRSAELDLKRFEALLEKNAGSRKQRDDAQARVDVARERQRAASERVQAARETLARLNAGARREELDAARARVAVVDAQVATLEKNVADADVAAPVAGIVTQKLADAGEVVAPGAPLAVVTDLDRAWANIFVPEPMVPRIALGQEATIRTDAGGMPIQGKVTYISPRAEFTPRNVQTAEERSKLVYRIKVTVDNREGVLKQGMPVDAELTLR